MGAHERAAPMRQFTLHPQRAQPTVQAGAARPAPDGQQALRLLIR